MSEQTIYNTILVPVTPFGTALYECRLCGALVLIEPPDYADQHLKWHERHDPEAK